ncbi:MAG TPA: hypothetical protein EYQ31_02325 [Candidatus Handelsmanbacteria bacterium]|nr:hypothetical protein [Candidatus Handelsmanbacteria bacterium]
MTEPRQSPNITTEVLLLAGLLVAGALLRLPGITRSLGHDEVYTRVMFAALPFIDIFTSYHLPNNHILHTLCVRTTTLLLGDAEWSVRLPALLAGLCAIPVLYGFSRHLTRSVGIATGTTLLLTLSTVHISFSQQSRGYTLVLLLGLVHAWALLVAIEQLRSDADPPDREWLPWTLAALAGVLAVLTIPSAAFFVGACAFAGAALIRLDLPRPSRHRARVHLFLSTACIVGVAILIYVPRIDDLYSHERFGVPLSMATWPAFVTDVWYGIGPQRWYLSSTVVAAIGGLLLLRRQRLGGLYLLGIFALPLLFSLAVATGGQPRVYVYLLPLICIAVAVAADELRLRLQSRLPAQRWARSIVTVVTFLPLAIPFCRLPSTPTESGYRAAGRWIQAQTKPGDVLVVPYIVDSAIGYYAAGMTVQRLRDAVGTGVGRLFFITHPGTARFDFEDLMLASNFTTDAAHHLDTYHNWSLPASAFAPVAHFDLTTVSRPVAALQSIDLGSLTQAQSWELFAQTTPDAARWSQQEGSNGELSMKLQLQTGAAVLHSVRTFVPAADGLALLAYTKLGSGYASLFVVEQDQRQALQMAKVLAAPASSVVDGEQRFDELYLRPVQEGVEYGLFVSASGGPAEMANWAVYYVRM